VTSGRGEGRVRAAGGTRAALLALGALVAGLALGTAVAASGSDLALRVVRAIEPIGVLWVNAIRMTVIPLIVASLVVAVAGADPRAMGRLGTRAFVVFVLLLVTMAALAVLAAPPLFERLVVDARAAAEIRAASGGVELPPLPSFASWLVGVVPVNPIRAAADGAMLPLVVFALLFGLALGRVAPALREPTVALFRGIAQATTTLVGWILALAPIGVFPLALSVAATLGAGVVGAVGFYIAAHAGLLVVSMLLLYAIVALAGTSPARFARAALPAQVVAASTRSSMAALPAMHASAERVLRLPRAVTSFALPLAVSTFRLNQPISWTTMALFAAALYGVELPLATVATLAATSVLLSFSVPGIPSGSLFVVAPFFAGVGIPAESVGLLIALDLVPDVFKTTSNVTGHLAAVSLVARGEAEAGETEPAAVAEPGAPLATVDGAPA
jgi:proton glutamate symport protein